jgi:A/G-specific adenine glycosylase
MLQQTTVATVASRFEPFLKRFPTLCDLACADEQDVLRAWEGLGYYRRALDLHRAARLLLENHGGKPPDDPEVWAALPGVGRYILGAVLSQAFDRRLPIVETNSRRVLCRLFGQKGAPGSGPVIAWLWRTAASILPRRHVGDFNQAVMELGALICAASNPQCGRCPVAALCAARREGLQDQIPARTKEPAIENIREAAVVVRRGKKVLLAQRPAAGRWANLWEFPRTEVRHRETIEDAVSRLFRERLGIAADIGQEMLTIRHAVTRFRITLVCLEANYLEGSVDSSYYQRVVWLEPAVVRSYPVCTPQRKLADELNKATRQPRLF